MDHRTLATALVVSLCACGADAPAPSPPQDGPLEVRAALGRSALDGLRTARAPSLGLSWQPIWARGLRQSGILGHAEALVPTSLAVGPHGRAAAGGAFVGLVDLDGVPLRVAGSRGAALVRYSEDGAVLWGRSFAARGDEVVRSVAVDYGESVLASGSLGPEALGPDGPAFPLGDEIVLAQFSDDGRGRWAVRATGALQAGPIAVQRSNHVIFSGVFQGSATLARDVLRARGGLDIVLARFTPDGTPLWISTVASGDDEEVLALAVGPDGEIALCVRSAPPAPAAPTLHLLRLDSEGVLRGSRALELPDGALQVAGLAVSAEGALVLAGTLRGAADLGGGPLFSDGASDLVVAAYGPGGAHLFSRRAGGPGADEASAVAIDHLGQILLAGTFSGPLRFGVDTLDSDGASDWLLATLGGDGEPLAADRLGGPGADRGAGLVVDGTRHLVLTGSLETTSPFGPSVLPGPTGVITQLFR